MTSPPRQRIRRATAAAIWLTLLVLLIGTLCLTLPRLGDPSDPGLIELVALTPFGVVTAVLAAMVAGGLALVRRGRAKFLAVTTTLLALALAAVHLIWLAPLFVGPSAKAAGGRPLVVMTQNLEYGDGADLARAARHNHVDLLVVSELSEPKLRQMLNAGIADQLPHHVGVEDRAPHGTVVFSRYPLTAPDALDLDGSMRSVQVRATPIGSVTLVAAHPRPPYRGVDWIHDYNVLQRYLAAQVTGGGAPIIVAGDLNATRDHAPFRRILDLPFTDAADEANGGYTPTWPASGHLHKLGLPVPALFHIDHVLISSNIVATKFVSTTVPGADHHGVLTVVHQVRNAEG